jgi:exopolysaccharide biosynthesis WecB/TagA/CpsF family protein
MRKSGRVIMGILEAYGATGCAHSAAALAGADPKTVRRYVAARNAGRSVNAPKARWARRRVGSIDFTALPPMDAIERVAQLGSNPRPAGTAIHFANACNVAPADTDERYRALMASGNLLGGMQDVLAQLEQRNYVPLPAALAAGTDSPPFATPTKDDLAARDERIRASNATLVWVGLGTHKQDLEVRRLADALPATALAVGAAFDFLAGATRQAPRWRQRSGLEWSYRQAQKPQRLARRYLWVNPQFVISVARRHLRRG